MLLTILKKIPILKPLGFFKGQDHWMALKKFVVLWLLSSAPVLFAVLLSPIPNGDASIISKFMAKLTSSITISEQLVYAASFISPILYVGYERFMALEDIPVKVRLTRAIDGLFKGYGFVAFIASLCWLCSLSAFSAIKVGEEEFRKTFLHHFLTEGALWFYLYALYCWYLSLLDSSTGPYDLHDDYKDQEDAAEEGFKIRIRGRA